jgi:hypothetical protein
LGDVHVPQAPVSSRHSSGPASVAEKPNDAELDPTVPLGPLEIDVFGAVVSTVQVRFAGVASMFPTVSMARTENVCSPSPSPEYAFGEPHAAQEPASSLHSNVPASLDENPNEAELDPTVPLGPLAIDVSGEPVSTVQVRLAGVASTFPTASIARTAKV